MAIRLRSTKPYWEKFSVYQSFETVKELNDTIKRFNKLYILTPATKSVLNTLKLHSKKTFIGVSWLYREEIAKKAKVSLSSVKRAIKELKDTGLLTVHENMHTEKGGRTHNVYVINPIFKNETPTSEPIFEPSEEDDKESQSLDTTDIFARDTEVYKNSHKNSNISLNHLSIEKDECLKFVPNEFIDLLEPFYSNNPEIIRERWKTLCIAAKKSCIKVRNLNWNSVKDAWRDVIKVYKRGKIKNASDDGIGAYFYGVLCDYFVDDFLRSHA